MLRETPGLELFCLDEEIAIARFASRMMIVIAYGFPAVLGIVGLLNLINTMITSVVTRRRELGLLQAVGLSNRQMSSMLRREGMLFTAGALAAGLLPGNLLGYLAFLWARNSGFSGLLYYQYPWRETIVMVAALTVAQLLISFLAGRHVRRDSIISRIQL